MKCPKIRVPSKSNTPNTEVIFRCSNCAFIYQICTNNRLYRKFCLANHIWVNTSWKLDRFLWQCRGTNKWLQKKTKPFFFNIKTNQHVVKTDLIFKVQCRSNKITSLQFSNTLRLCLGAKKVIFFKKCPYFEPCHIKPKVKLRQKYIRLLEIKMEGN